MSSVDLHSTGGNSNLSESQWQYLNIAQMTREQTVAIALKAVQSQLEHRGIYTAIRQSTAPGIEEKMKKIEEKLSRKVYDRLQELFSTHGYMDCKVVMETAEVEVEDFLASLKKDPKTQQGEVA